MPTPKANVKIASLRRMLDAAVERLIAAEIAETESGMYPPETWPDVERELELAKAGYKRLRDRMLVMIAEGSANG